MSNKAIGTRVNKIREIGYPFNRKDGLVFCRLSIVSDEVNKEIYKGVNLNS